MRQRSPLARAHVLVMRRRAVARRSCSRLMQVAMRMMREEIRMMRISIHAMRTEIAMMRAEVVVVRESAFVMRALVVVPFARTALEPSSSPVMRIRLPLCAPGAGLLGILIGLGAPDAALVRPCGAVVPISLPLSAAGIAAMRGQPHSAGGLPAEWGFAVGGLAA